jgi:hypothetical protein
MGEKSYGVTSHRENDNNDLVPPQESRNENCLPASPLRGCLEVRHNVNASVAVHLIDLAARVQGRIVDISLGGCHIRTDRRFPVGIFRRVEIEFRIDGLPFRLGGVTQALYDPINVGIRFLDLSDRKRAQLFQLIQEIEMTERPPG